MTVYLEPIDYSNKVSAIPKSYVGQLHYTFNGFSFFNYYTVTSSSKTIILRLATVLLVLSLYK